MPDPSEPVPAPARPLWTVFLIPAAIVIAGLVAGGSFWLTRGDPPTAPTPAHDSAVGASKSSALPVAVASPEVQAGLVATFGGYARQLGLDEPKFTACLGNPEWTKIVNAQLKRGVALGVTGTPTFFINNKMVVGSQPAAIYEEVINAELRGSPASINEYSAAIQAMAQDGSFKIIDAPVDVTDAQFEGNPKAKVIIAEFSDFQCPFCKRFVDQALAAIRKKEGADVALAFLHFPIVKLHPNAGNASAAAVCAADQGRFWPMHDLLFKNQAAWQNLQ